MNTTEKMFSNFQALKEARKNKGRKSKRSIAMNLKVLTIENRIRSMA